MSEIYFTTVGLFERKKEKKTVGVKCSIMEEEEKREKGTGRRRNERESEVRKRKEKQIMVKGHVFILFHFLQRPKTY